MDPQEILRQALEALEGGATEEAVDARIAKLREQGVTEFPNLFALRSSIEGAEQKEISEAGLRVAGDRDTRGQQFRGGASDFARMLAQGATFGFADELVGLAGGDVEASRQRVEDLRTAQPGASLASEVAGGFLLPGVGGARAAQAGGRTARAAGRGALATGALGAAGGGLFGLGEAEGTLLERAEEAKTPAVVGGLLGAATGGAGGAAGSVLRRRAESRGAQVAEALSRTSGVSADITGARASTRAAQGAIQQRLYRPLEEAFPSVSDPNVNNFIRELSDQPGTRALVRKLGLSPARGVPGPARTPSFQDLQALRQQLRKRAFDSRGGVKDAVASDLADELSDLMGDTFGEPLRRADATWRQTVQQLDNLDLGWRKYNEPTAQIEEITRRMSDSQRQAFNQGRVSRIDAKLRERDKEAVGLLRKLLDSGTETRNQFRTLFPDEQTFDQFQRFLESERSLDRVLDVYSSLARPLAVGVGAGAAFGTARSLFGN